MRVLRKISYILIKMVMWGIRRLVETNSAKWEYFHFDAHPFIHVKLDYCTPFVYPCVRGEYYNTGKTLSRTNANRITLSFEKEENAYNFD